MKSLSRYTALAITVLAFSNFALAQMGGGRGGSQGSGPQTGTPPAGAPDGMRGPGGPGGPNGGRLVVASDGKALLVQHTAAASSTSAPTIELVAVNPAGVVAWTWTSPAGIRDIALVSNLVVVSVGGQAATTSTTAVADQLIALNLASGTQAWAASVDGNPGQVTATSNGFLVVVHKVTAATGTATQPTVTRSLVSYDLAGKVVWTLALPV
jgi:outer membrane protein assembly factor BamB